MPAPAMPGEDPDDPYEMPEAHAEPGETYYDVNEQEAKMLRAKAPDCGRSEPKAKRLT